MSWEDLWIWAVSIGGAIIIIGGAIVFEVAFIVWTLRLLGVQI